MKFLSFLREFAVTFVLVLIVNAIVIYFYELIAHGSGAFNWERSVQFAIILGIVLPLNKIIK